MKTKPSTEYALLGALMTGPKHGYEIMQFLGTAFGSTWHVGTSQLYALLRRLEGDNLLGSKLKTQDTRPSKRIFSLTAEGEKLFLAWLQAPTEHVRDLRIEFLAKLFFFNRLSLKGGRELIKAQIQVLEQIRERIKQRQKKEKDTFNRLVFGFKIATVEAWLEWLLKQAKPFINEVQDNG
ncbi:MAG: PadR family transcriptional regulator [Desulfobacteraceae bacterium]|nr:PadR family transcriptional regulator [Desulfobacteraceae bacterium]